MSDIRQWLEQLGFGKYADAFERDVEAGHAHPELTSEILKDIGVPAGPRAKLLAAIQALKQEDPAAKSDTIEPAAPTEAPATAREAERRQLTVMFCDMVGSTALSEKLDPEDLRDVMRAYQDACAGAIEAFDGHIAQTLGDGLMVYFGYPIAHEDDPQRAIRAGLDIVSRVAELEADVAVRVGVHTGLVVAGEVGGADTRGDMAVVGETPNIAARIEGLAEPGTVVVGERTRRLAGDVFDYEDLGARDLKGLSKPMPVFRVTAERAAESRFEATHRGGLTPFVGRDEEIGLLLRRWEEAKEGDGQVVLLSGEPGIGKSRIADTFRERIAVDPHTRVQYQCSPFYANSAFYPVINQLERAAKFDGAVDPDAKLDKLEALLGQSGDAAAETPTLLAAMMSLPIDRYPPLNMSPQRQKQRTIEVLVEGLVALADSKPLLIVFEDAHWIDPTTQGLLDLMVPLVAKHAVLLVITHRPEFTPPWHGLGHVLPVVLSRLGRSQAATMVERVTGGKPLPKDVLDQIVAKTDGVPLFVEELTKTVLDGGADGAVEIPATLQDSLMARLDRLTAKEVAQIGACIGREFSHAVLTAVSSLDDIALDEALMQLVESELVHRTGTPPDATYAFKHALIQDAAHQSLLRTNRRNWHRKIAAFLASMTEVFPNLPECQPEILARHYAEADMAGPAVAQWRKAAAHAIERSAIVEAIAYLKAGLAMVEKLTDLGERARAEIGLRVAVGGALSLSQGWAAAPVEAAYERASALCRDITDMQLLFPVLMGLFRFHLVRGELATARQIADQIAAPTKGSGEPLLILGANFAIGVATFHLGETARACAAFERSLAVYDVRDHRPLALSFGEDVGVVCLVHSALAAWLIGRVDDALARAEQAIAHGRKLDHPHSLAFALEFSSHVRRLRREPAAAQALVDELLTLSAEQGFPHFQARGAMVGGWVAVEGGEAETGVAMMRAGLDGWRMTGARLWVPSFLTMIGDGLYRAGRPDDARDAFAEAHAVVETNGEAFWQAETCRLEGEWAGADAEPHFLRALDLARTQGALTLELRAATSLAGQWRSEDRIEDARALLGQVYERFTEGFDTADLKDAKALLEGLR